MNFVITNAMIAIHYVLSILTAAYHACADAAVLGASTTRSWFNTARTSVATFIAPKVLA